MIFLYKFRYLIYTVVGLALSFSIVLFFTIQDIDTVIFKIVKSNARASGFSGRMQVVKRNGKADRSYILQPKLPCRPNGGHS